MARCGEGAGAQFDPRLRRQDEEQTGQEERGPRQDGTGRPGGDAVGRARSRSLSRYSCLGYSISSDPP